MNTNMKQLLRRVRGMSLKRMEACVAASHRESGESKAFIRADMIRCAMTMGVGYQDYRVFGFAANRNPDKRATFMTMTHNQLVARCLNSRARLEVLTDKGKFNEAFRAELGRDFLLLTEKNGEEAFLDFCQGKASIFAKRRKSFGGQGIEKIDLIAETDLQSLFARLLEEGKDLVEDTVIQHPDLSSLSRQSVNTLRLVTLRGKDNEIHLMYALLRMGNGGAAVDNISSGGLYALLDEEGRLSARAFCDKTGKFYEKHPEQNVSFAGYTVPFFHEAAELCRKSAERLPELGYIGWDAAITANGPVLIEGNHLPGYDMCQNVGLNHTDTGILPYFRQVLGESFFDA